MHADRIKVGLALSDLHKQGKAERVPALKSGAPNLWKPAARKRKTTAPEDAEKAK